jgi:hypothetical protein
MIICLLAGGGFPPGQQMLEAGGRGIYGGVRIGLEKMQQSDDEVLEKYGLQPDQLELGEVLSGDGAFGLVRNGTLHRGTGSSSGKVRIQSSSFLLNCAWTYSLFCLMFA